MLKCAVVLGVAFSFMACTSQSNKSIMSYIDTKQFFETEIERLTTSKTGVQKQLSFDGKQQVVNTPNINWKKELDAFIAIDLQKVSYKNRFDIDTITTNDTLYEVRYKANDAKVDLRSCIFWIHTITQKIYSMEAVFTDRNSLYQSTKIFSYNTNNGYTITGKQAVKLGNEINYEIVTRFKTP